MVESVTPDPLAHLTSWHSEWSGSHAVVVGLGATGFAVSDTLRELGAAVTVVARDAEEDVVNIALVIGASVVVSPDSAMRDAAIRSSGADFAVVSPGVSADDPAILALLDLGIPVLSDVDFAWRVRDKYDNAPQWIVVAGERYGSRISDLASRILIADGRTTGVAGYQEQPLLDLIRDPVFYEHIIVHASSSSLAWWSGLPLSPRTPLISVCVEETMQPGSAVLYDGTSLACVYWRSSGDTESLVEASEVTEGARAIGVGVGAPGMSELGLVEGIVCDRAFLDDRKNQALEISTVEELAEAGWDLPSELPPLLASIAVARALDVTPALIAGVISLP
jgi:UDP-N-acetylmuramoylalanine--D-glutamate ligase